MSIGGQAYPKPDRRTYNHTGSGVIPASRIGQLTRAVGSQWLISPEAYERLPTQPLRCGADWRCSPESQEQEVPAWKVA